MGALDLWSMLTVSISVFSFIFIAVQCSTICTSLSMQPISTSHSQRPSVVTSWSRRSPAQLLVAQTHQPSPYY